jgi:hypothetical protein
MPDPASQSQAFKITVLPTECRGGILVFLVPLSPLEDSKWSGKFIDRPVSHEHCPYLAVRTSQCLALPGLAVKITSLSGSEYLVRHDYDSTCLWLNLRA